LSNESKIIRNVCFRVDGNTEIGLGHIVRCLALAQILCVTYTILFYCKSIPEVLKKKIAELGFGLNIIGSELDFFQMFDSNDIIVIDNYGFDTKYHNLIKSNGNKLVVIDDFCNIHYNSDLIINHSPKVIKSNYDAEPYTEYCLGLDYCLLRPPFLEAIHFRSKSRIINSLLITFGGSDIQNITYRALQLLAEKQQIFSRINIVIGPSYPYLDKLKDLISALTFEVYLYNVLDENEMCDLFLSSEYALVPSSGVLFEALACGCKPISGYCIDNQVQVYSDFKLLDAIIDAHDFSNEKILCAFKKTQDKSLKINTDIFKSGIQKRFLDKFKNL